MAEKIGNISTILHEASQINAPQTSVWLGRCVKLLKSFKQLGTPQAIAFLVVQKGISWKIKTVLQPTVKNERNLMIFSNICGGTIAYGLSEGLAAAGFIATPMTIPPAIVLTVLSIAFDILWKKDVKKIPEKKEEIPLKKIGITIILPEVMKMQSFAYLEVDRTKSLKEIKKMIFEEFWKQTIRLYPSFKRGGTPEENISLLNGRWDPWDEPLSKQTRIEKIFKRFSEDCIQFTAYFSGDPYHYR